MLFLSYASPDKERVEPFFDSLDQMGFEPWMDCRKLRAGQNWDFEIQRALDKAKIVLIFLSNNSVDRRGYVQREIKAALRRLEEKLIDDVYIIPVMLEEVVRPVELKKIQFVDATSPDCLEQIKVSVEDQLERLGEIHDRPAKLDGLTFSRRKYRDSYDGIPGFEITAEFVSFRSDEYKNIENINCAISGDISRSIMSSRDCIIHPSPSHFNLGQAKWSRTNTLDWVLSEVRLSGRLLSVVYTVHYYGGGAVHPISGFETFNFFLNPVLEIAKLEDMFENDAALVIIRDQAREQLRQSLLEIAGSEPDSDWIKRGTEFWECFRHFSVEDGMFTVYFGSYAVGAYAYGHQLVTIPVKDVAMHLNEFAANSLDVGWIRRAGRS